MKKLFHFLALAALMMLSVQVHAYNMYVYHWGEGNDNHSFGSMHYDNDGSYYYWKIDGSSLKFDNSGYAHFLCYVENVDNMMHAQQNDGREITSSGINGIGMWQYDTNNREIYLNKSAFTDYEDYDFEFRISNVNNDNGYYGELSVVVTKHNDEPVIADSYYLVSPELTGGELQDRFKLVASRNRSGRYGNGQMSTTYYSINIKDDDISKITSSKDIHWYITNADKTVQYRPFHSGNDNFELGIKGSQNIYGRDGNVQSGTYDNSRTTSDFNNQFLLKQGTGVSYTIFLKTDNPVTMNINKQALPDRGEYYLIGNFTSATDVESIDLTNKEYKMTKYWYKNTFAYDHEVADADSIVYKVKVNKPANGWGNLYLDVNYKGNSDWNNVIRPEVTLVKNTVDGRATHGGLVEYYNLDQSLNPEVDPMYTSYTFSMNITTSTYRIDFESNIYIVGTAVGETASATHSFSNKIKLDYNDELKCYEYKGNDNQLHFLNGGQFRIIAADEAGNVLHDWSENANEPYEVSGTTYSAATVNGETQYKNYLNYHEPPTNVTDADTDASLGEGNHNVKFALGTGSYIIRFYLNKDDMSRSYYTIDHEANVIVTPDRNDEVGSGSSFDVFAKVVYAGADDKTVGRRRFVYSVSTTPVEPEINEDGTETDENIFLGNYYYTDDNTRSTAGTFTQGTDNKVTFKAEREEGTLELGTVTADKPVTVYLNAYAIVEEDGKFKVSGSMARAVYTFNNFTPEPIEVAFVKELRTFSDAYSRSLSTDNGTVKAYIATKIEQSDNSKTRMTVTLQEIKNIPANTGVILKTTDVSKDYKLPFLEVQPDKIETNYLVPSVTPTWVATSDFEEEDGKQVIVARNFFFAYKADQGGYVFGRAISGLLGEHKSFLRVTHDLINANIQYGDQSAIDEDPQAKNISIIWQDLDGGQTTSLLNVNETETTDNSYYTLQGIRTEKPLRGIYIHNGKAIIIK